jgi:hypothetical protein
MVEVLPSWRDGATKQAIVDFVRRTCGGDGSNAVPVEERVAVFDNDGRSGADGWIPRPAATGGCRRTRRTSTPPTPDQKTTRRAVADHNSAATAAAGSSGG